MLIRASPPRIIPGFPSSSHYPSAYGSATPATSAVWPGSPTLATDKVYDLVVVGSGAGGLSTAVTAAYLGLNVVVLEKDSHVGGATAWSGGWMWIPRNPLAVEAGTIEDISAPRAYLQAELGGAFDSARVDAYLSQGPNMVAFFRDRTSVAFVDGNAIPDFHDKTPFSARGGRSICAAPFDARLLGKDVHRMRGPLRSDFAVRHGDRIGRRYAPFPQRNAKVGIFRARRQARRASHH